MQVQSSIWDPAAPNLPSWLRAVLQWGSTNDFVSRWAAVRVGVSFSVHLSSASLSKGTLGTPPDLQLSPPRASSMKLCFRGPTKQCVGGMTLLSSLFLAPVTVGDSWSNYCKKDQLTNPRKREPVMCFLFRFQRAQSPSAAGNKTELISA